MLNDKEVREKYIEKNNDEDVSYESIYGLDYGKFFDASRDLICFTQS